MITIRKAALEDAKVLADIMIESWHAAFVGIMRDETIKECTGAEGTEKMMKEILQAGKGTFYVGEIDGTPVGELFWCPGEDENSAEILALHSMKESWGTGLGKALVEQAVKDIKETGKSTIYLWAFKENQRGRRFYEKFGFTHNKEERVSDFDGALEVKYILKI